MHVQDTTWEKVLKPGSSEQSFTDEENDVNYGDKIIACHGSSTRLLLIWCSVSMSDKKYDSMTYAVQPQAESDHKCAAVRPPRDQ
eukprot:scaffold276007_cov16-Prasinocladus_malaysianus.AAC.1